ncbi:polyprotein [Arachis hypogaea]|nr:polyprotein [Arachis hypogaea]
MSKLFRSLSRRLSFSSPSSSSSSPIHSSSNPLTEKVTHPEELSPKHNIFEEEVCFEDINQAIDNWEIPKIPQDELYVPDDNKRKSDYIIKTAENNIPLGPDSVKPLIREGLNASILMCLRDIRHNDFQDSLIGTVETSLGHGPVYFNCFPNKTVSLLDLNILDSLFLNIRIHGLNMKEGSIPAALIYRIQYKVMNTCNSRVLLKSQDRETTLFVTDMTKANVMIPRLIRWDEIDLPQSWSIDRAIPTQPRQAPLLREVKQVESGKVEIFFDRRNSFSSRSEAGTSNDFASARRSFSVTSQSQFSKMSRPANSEIHISGLQNNLSISQGVYQEDDGDVEFEVESSIPSHQSPTYSSLNANVISTWKVKDGNLVRSEFPPKGAFIISNTEGHNPVMASPFKTKNVDEAVAPKDIKNLIEQSNYTNKFLQCLGDNLSSSGSTFSLKNVSEASTSKSIEKSLFKPFKISSKAKQSLKTSILKQQSSDSEVIQKIDQLLNRFTTIPETPTNSGESTSRIQTRASKAINALGLESNESCSEQSDDSGKSSLKISPILTNSLTKWKGLTKPSTYGYNRVSAPDLALEERELGFVSFNANNVYEWNIDGKTEYNIMSMLQHMTMVGTAYQAAHDTSEEAIANVIVSGFSGQLKGWWDNYLFDNQNTLVQAST